MGNLTIVPHTPENAFQAALSGLLNHPYPAVMCVCGHCIFTHSGVIRSRCVKVAEGVALCRCKRWVKVPVGIEMGVMSHVSYAVSQ
ncbi:hypothetical protein NMT39_000308 [Vibrio cholerae]|nr:hypothetical protein [Vibrio cholerae]